MVKSYVAHVIIVSSPVPQDLRFLTPLGLGLGLGLGGQGLGLGFDNKNMYVIHMYHQCVNLEPGLFISI